MISIDNPLVCTDIMVDLETTSTNIPEAAILQISAIMFNLGEGLVGPSFNRWLYICPDKRWSPSTYSFWMNNPDHKKILLEGLDQMEEPKLVIDDFVSWVRKSGVKHFWSKPLSFDYPLLDVYFTKFGYKNPFSYWKARDMRSYLLGLMFPEPLPDLKVTDKTKAHNALEDVKSQINYLLKYHRQYHTAKEKSDEKTI